MTMNAVAISLGVVLLCSIVQLGMTAEPNYASLISPNNVVIKIKGVFGIPIQYTETSTPVKLLVKGGGVVSIYCHGKHG